MSKNDKLPIYSLRNWEHSEGRGVATLGSSRHVPTHNFHKILRKICIKWNVYIFLVFNVFSKIGNKIVIQLDLSS